MLCPVLSLTSHMLLGLSLDVGGGDARVDKDSAVMPPDHAEIDVAVQDVAKDLAMTTDGAVESVRHRPIVSQSFVGTSTQQKFGRQNAGVFAQIAPGCFVLVEQVLPFVQVRILLDLEGSAGEPYGQPIGGVRIRDHIPLIGQKAADGFPDHVLFVVGFEAFHCAATTCLMGLDRERHRDAASTNTGVE